MRQLFRKVLGVRDEEDEMVALHSSVQYIISMNIYTATVHTYTLASSTKRTSPFDTSST
jgi:hypothetical protein